MSAGSSARYRVISDNDYAGDPDGLIQLAHHALCPSVQLTAVIGSQLKPLDGVGGFGRTAEDACAKAREVLELLRIEDVPVIAGSDTPMTDRQTPIDNAAAAAIIDEAMRTDDERPLFVCLGAGLTSLASAWLLEPRIAQRLTAVWIGGAEHPDLAEPAPGAEPCEYNTGIDIPSAQVVFNDSDIPLWQVPRDAYRQVIASMAELELWLRPCGRIGAYLYERLDSAVTTMAAHGLPGAETYVLGDSPLVSLTALQTMFEAGPASSLSVLRPAPLLGDDGAYLVDASGALRQTRADRPIRVFTQLDSALIIRDTYAKLAAFARREQAVR
jgi:purine nucleosidase